MYCVCVISRYARCVMYVLAAAADAYYLSDCPMKMNISAVRRWKQNTNKKLIDRDGCNLKLNPHRI